MRKRTKKYALMQSYAISKEGISIYKVSRDEESLADELMEKYIRDVRELLDAKLERLTLQYKVPIKEIDRIRDLISEIEKVTEIK